MGNGRGVGMTRLFERGLERSMNLPHRVLSQASILPRVHASKITAGNQSVSILAIHLQGYGNAKAAFAAVFRSDTASVKPDDAPGQHHAQTRRSLIAGAAQSEVPVELFARQRISVARNGPMRLPAVRCAL